MTNSTGAFAAPALFEVLLDRIASDVYPSERFVMSAAMSATTVEQIDQLLKVVGRQQLGHYLSPRRLDLLGRIAERRALVEPARRAVTKLRDPDVSNSDIEPDELRSAVELLERSSKLLN